MSKFHAKRFGHIDANHREIANALRSAGFSVGETSASANLTDLIVSGGSNATALVEIKTEEKDAKFQISQLEAMANWKGYVVFVSNAEMAIRIMRNLPLYALTEKQKLKLLQFVVRKKAESKDANPRVSVSVIDKLLSENGLVN